MAMVPDEIARPLIVMDKLFDKQADPMINGCAEFAAEKAHFRQALQLDDEEGLARIPCINDAELAESVPPFSLVRYRCLVQDVFEPELYTPVLQEVDEVSGSRRLVSTKYRERVEPLPGRRLESADGCFAQRGACYCVPLPGEQEWARRAAVEWTVACGGAAKMFQPAKTEGSSTATKRSRPDDDVNMAPEEEVTQRPRVTQAANGCKRVTPSSGKCITNGIKEGFKTSEEFGLNFPISSEERLGRGSATACIVKLYDDDAEALQVCNVVEVIGVLCVNPEIADLPVGTKSMEDAWRDARNPSTALVPRLHAVAIRSLPFYHPLLPYSPSWLTEARLASAFMRQFAAPDGALIAARSAAIDHLTKQLGGDTLAAEYMLMLLVSRSFAQYGGKSLGDWSLNLASWPQNCCVNALTMAAGELVPRAVHLEVNAETLNAKRWRPRKDFIANRLVASQLQLAPGTLVVLDETNMDEGKLWADGLKNLLAIRSLVTDSRLACDFMSYDVKVPLEVPCALVSTRKSIVKDVDVRVPLRVNGSVLPSKVVPQASLDAARWLLSLVTRSPRAARIPDVVIHAFGEDFASVRQTFKVKEDLCHTWMCLARARCLTFGEEEVTIQRWREVLELERARLSRCREEGMVED